MTMMRRSGQQRGLSLIELMISLAISSMVTLGLIQMFEANQETSGMLRGQAFMGESGRFATEMIARSVRKAGYRGCNSKRAIEDTINTVPYEFALTNGIRGYEGSGSSWSPDFSTTLMPREQSGSSSNLYTPSCSETPADTDSCTSESSAGIDIDKLQPDTDVITVWFAGDTEYAIDTATQAMATGAETILLTDSMATIDPALSQFHVALINDCATENMFVITQIANAGGQAELSHVAGVGVGATQNLTPTLGAGSGYQAGAVILPIHSHTFFVAESDNKNEFGDPIYSLFRKDTVGEPVELVEGIEDLQVLYGVDRGGEILVPSSYVTASNVSTDEWDDIVAVRIAVTANSVDKVTSDDDDASSEADGMLRRTYSSTIRVRNRLRKE